MLISSKESLNHNSLWEMACFPQLLNHSNLAFLPPSLSFLATVVCSVARVLWYHNTTELSSLLSSPEWRPTVPRALYFTLPALAVPVAKVSARASQQESSCCPLTFSPRA